MTARSLSTDVGGGTKSKLERLAQSPSELRKLSTDRVIQAALAKPDMPWAWSELEKRPLTAAESGQIIDGMTAWLRREHPSGPSTPLIMVDRFLERLDARHLISEEQKIRFLVALHGDLRIDPLARLREGDHRLDVLGESRYIWRQNFLGLEMMNASFSASVDGQPVKFEGNFDDNWNVQHFGNVLTLPELAPGRHKLKLEVLSALAAKEDLAGLSSRAPPAEWPPAKKRWTRSIELEFTVYPRDAVIVAQTEDPALDPLSNGSLGIKPVLIRSKDDRAQAVLNFTVADSLPVPISFDVSLRAGDQTIACGTLWAVKTHRRSASSGEEMTVELDRPTPELKAADVVLTPNPKPAEQHTSVDRIWGREIVFKQVRLIRQDLGEVATSVAQTTSSEPSRAVQVQISERPKRVVALLPVGLLGGLLLLLVGTAIVVGLVLLLRRKKSGGAGNVIAIGCASFAVAGILVVVLLGVGGLFWSRASMEAARRMETVQRDLVQAQLAAGAKAIELRRIQDGTVRVVTASNLVFGPVIKRVVQARQTGTNAFLDLDNNKLLTPSPDITEGFGATRSAGQSEGYWQGLDILPNTAPAKYLAWLKESGADLMYNDRERVIAFDGVWALAHGTNSATWDSWDGLTPEMVRQAVAEIERATRKTSSGITTVKKGDNRIYTSAQRLHSRYAGTKVNELTRAQSSMWYFKTREDGMGILQITGFTENPRGAKIRYKLVQPRESRPLAAPQSRQSQPATTPRDESSAPTFPRFAWGDCLAIWRVEQSPEPLTVFIMEGRVLTDPAPLLARLAAVKQRKWWTALACAPSFHKAHPADS
jgi:hypothetical protein